MPTTPYARLRVSLDGGSPLTGGITDATLSQSCQLSIETTAGVETYKWLIVDYPPDFECPEGWLEDPRDGSLYTYDPVPTAFTLTHWGKYLFGLQINRAWDQGGPEKLSDFSRTGISIASPAGFVDFSYREKQEFDQRGWPEGQRENLRLLSDGAAGPASAVNYNNSTSGLAATNVQTALDEVAADTGAVYLEVSGSTHTVTAADWGSKDPATVPLYIIYTGTTGGFALTLRSSPAAGETVYLVRTSSAEAQSISIVPTSASVQISSDGTLSNSSQLWQSSSTGVGLICGLRAVGTPRRWLPIAGQRPNYYAPGHVRTMSANSALVSIAAGGASELDVSADMMVARDGSANLAAMQHSRLARMATQSLASTAVNSDLTHVGAALRFTLGSAGTYTVLAQATVAWIANSVIHIELTATSQPLTITPDTGVTITSIDGDGLVLYAGQCATLRRISSDTWVLTTARRIKGLTVGPAGSVPGAGPLRYVATGIAGVTTELTSRSLQGNAALADAATFTAAVEIPSTNNTVTKVRWFWYVGVAGTPSYAGGYFDVIYLRESSASDLHVLAAGYSSGSSAPLGWTIAASTDTGSGGQFRLLMTNGTGAARKAYARPQLSTEALS